MVDLTDWGFQIATKKSYSVQTTQNDQRDMSTLVTNTSSDNRVTTYSPTITYIINSAGASTNSNVNPTASNVQTPSVTTKKTTTSEQTPTTSQNTSSPNITSSITTIGVVAVVVGGIYLFFKKK